MKFVKQNLSLDIQNIDEIANSVTGHDESFRKHGNLFPNSIRCAIVAPSGAGKTSLLMQFLLSSNSVNFENIYIYSKSLFQPKYQYLKKLVNSIKGMEFFEYPDTSEVIPIESVKPESLVIWDDICYKNQKNLGTYFQMGRHYNVSSFILIQTYVKVLKHIRENLNFLVIFPIDEMNLKHIYTDHLSNDFKCFAEFKNICLKCWSTPHSYFVFDKESSRNNGRYRRCIDEFIQLE